MVELKKLSAEGQSIVEKYISGSILLVDNKKRQLVASLYAMSIDANPKVIDILKPYIINLNDSLSEDDLGKLRKEYRAVVRYCHARKGPDLGFTSSSDNQPLLLPSSVLELCNKLLDIPKDSNVFLPYAATAQLAFENPELNYDGFEIDPETWAFTKIYLDCQEIDSSIRLTGNLYEALHDGKPYDLIFSFPPFIAGREGRTVIDNIYHLATKSLKDGGTLCCVLPLNFCTAPSGWFDVRKILWDYNNQYSAAVISLPTAILAPYTSIATCLFFLTKDGQDNILLVDASGPDFCARHDIAGDKEYELKVQSIIETIQKSDERFVWGGKVSDLIGDVCLLPSRYLISQYLPRPRKGERLVPLRELVDIVPLEKNTDNSEQYPLLGIKELSDNYLNCDITFDSIPLKPKNSFRMLGENCLLAGFIGGKFKVGRTIDLSSEKRTALRHEVIAFRLKSDMITEDFLLRSIMSNNVEFQGRKMSSGATIARIKKEDFLDLKILLPSLEEQNLLTKKDSKDGISEAEQKLKNAHEEYVKMLRMRKHRIQQVMNELSPAFSLLNKYRKEHGGTIHDNDVVANRTGETVGNYFDKIEGVLTKVENLITNLVDKDVWEDSSIINIDQYVDSISQSHLSPIFDIKVFHNRDISIYEEGENVDLNDPRLIQINENDLATIFDNIIANASKWGFMDNTRNDYVVQIIVGDAMLDDRQAVQIVCSNNGEPIHPSLDRSRFFDWGYGSGTGIGTSQLKDIVWHYGGTIRLLEFPSEPFGFCTAYEIVLPLIDNK